MEKKVDLHVSGDPQELPALQTPGGHIIASVCVCFFFPRLSDPPGLFPQQERWVLGCSLGDFLFLGSLQAEALCLSLCCLGPQALPLSWPV